MALEFWQINYDKSSNSTFSVIVRIDSQSKKSLAFETIGEDGVYNKMRPKLPRLPLLRCFRLLLATQTQKTTTLLLKYDSRIAQF